MSNNFAWSGEHRERREQLSNLKEEEVRLQNVNEEEPCVFKN